jgi:hypothetical protein
MSASAEPIATLVTSLGIFAAAYSITAHLVPRVAPCFVERGLSGVDLLKTNGRGAHRKGPEV